MLARFECTWGRLCPPLAYGERPGGSCLCVFGGFGGSPGKPCSGFPRPASWRDSRGTLSWGRERGEEEDDDDVPVDDTDEDDPVDDVDDLA